MATIKDIADEVGISKAAVSRILNHKGSFNQETIKKVERAAKRLNYTPISMLRQENNKDEKVIAVVLPPTISPYYGILINLIEQAAYDYRYSILICSSVFNRENETAFFQLLREKNVSGLILGTFEQDTEYLLEQEIPIVTLGFKSSDKITSVRSDNYAGGCLAARHLSGKSCKKLLYISGFPEGLKYDERYKGFAEEAERRGCDVWAYQIDPDLIETPDASGIITQISLEHSDAEGIFFESFKLGVKLFQTFSELDYRIPEDIKIIGYGNPFLSAYSYPPITVILENTRQIVSRAVTELVDLIENEDAEETSLAKDILIPVSLKIGKTT